MEFEFRKEIPPPNPGFEDINRYWDRTRKMVSAKILPGEYYATGDSEIITTVLGSCIATCMFDRERGVAGMNHFMLPSSISGALDGGIGQEDMASARYGNWSMEFLVNALLKLGAKKERLEVKIFGGAHVMGEEAIVNVGKKNIEFVQSYLEREGMRCISQDVGGQEARKVVYTSSTGKAMVKRFKKTNNETISRRESEYRAKISTRKSAGDIELF